jgi:hypothetical protein
MMWAVAHLHFHVDLGRSVVACQVDCDRLIRLVHVEAGTVVDARIDATADDYVGDGRAVAARYVDAVAEAFVILPLDCDPMRRVLAAETDPARKRSRSQFGYAEQTDASNGIAVDELRAERTREQRRGDLGIDAVVDKQSSVDDPVDRWTFHATLHWRNNRKA